MSQLHANTLHTRGMELTTKEYLELLPRCEQEFFRHWLKAIRSNGNSALPTAMTTVHSEQLTQLLVDQPYPTLQIMKLSREQSKKHISRVLADALQVLLTQNADNYTPQFINFLMNLPLSTLDAPALRAKLIQQLTLPTPHSDDAYLALLARTEPHLLVEVLEKGQKQWHKCVIGVPSKEFVLFQALRNKEHFAPHCAIQLKDIRTVADVGLRNNLLILKIANDFSNPTQTLAELGNINKWLDAFSATASPTHLQQVHKFFYADLRRIATILDFLKKYGETFKSITIEALLNASSILKLIYDHDINSSFEDTRRVIESINKWQSQMPSMKPIHELEVETLHYHEALSTVYDVILADTTRSLDDYYIGKMQHLNAMLRKMLNIDMLCTLIEDIFQLVFLRWEHLRSDTAKCFATFHANRSRSMRSSNTSSTDDAAADTPAAKGNSPARGAGVRYGFICRGRALQAIFTFLKGFVTKKLHSEDYKLASDRIQLRFQRIVDVIGEALWKYSVLEKIDNSLTQAGTQQLYMLEAEELLQLVHVHTALTEKSSSDDDSRDRCNYTSLSRRKAARKKRRATFSGASGGITRPTQQELEQSRARASIMISSVGAVQNIDDCVTAQLKARKILNRFTDRSIIPQMLGSPENLAIMALALKNFNDVKFIIENFNLQNTEMNRELNFAEQQQQVKQKLATIYANYQRQEEKSLDTGPPKATVEQIKNVAAKGFEVSRIINVIDTFAQSQRICQTVEQQQLLQKHLNNPQYPFLYHFEEQRLNSIIVTDLVLNMPLNREITSNVLMVIRRQQELRSIFRDDLDIVRTPSSSVSIKSQLPRDVGAMSVLENLSECLRLLDRRTLRELLCDNYYSLKPDKLALELQRERAFHTVFYKATNEIGRLDELRAHATLFQDLQSKCNYYQRFNFYVQQLAQLVQLRDRNMEYHASALLKIDACDVIGELLFDSDMTPLEIEANVSALNLNLVHVIALNVCPEIAGKCSNNRARPLLAAQKTANILNYVANQNHLLAYLLQGVIDVQHTSVSHGNLSTAYLKRFTECPEIATLSTLFGGNKFVAALRSDCVDMKLIAQLDCKLKQLDVLKLNVGHQESKLLQSTHIDNLVVQLIAEDAKHISLAANIHDIALRAKLIYENFTKIATTRLAKELIENTLQHRAADACVPALLRRQLENTLADITIYAKVSDVLQFETWPQAYDFGMKTPNTIFEKLLQLHLYKLCYNWCKVLKLSTRFAPQKQKFLAVLLNALLELRDDDVDDAQSAREMNAYLLKILETFESDDCVAFLDANKDKFRSVLLLRYAVDFLTKHNPSGETYRNYKISLVIFEQLTPVERVQFWNVFKYPLLIIEQLIMNAKFEILTKVLIAVRGALQQAEALDAHVCTFCFDKRGHIYDIHTRPTNSPHKVQFHLGASTAKATNSAFILLNFNLYQKNHLITNECIDLLLRVYGTKALDYHVSDTTSSSERISQTTDLQQSLDSLCGAFQMPTVVPTREDWVRDDEATHCMCCRRAAFTMLMRRHHCRRCGRVICFACSTHRMRIPELYADVEVRICNDCFGKTEEAQQKQQRDAAAHADGQGNAVRARSVRDNDAFKWKLSGNITHDKLLREEFCYEHAPSVALCLSILGYHLGQQKCVDLLLYHCHKLEKLIVPNPEVDYELVAKMMNCLALAAKVRGGPAEVETIREHSEIIMSVVQNGCESLIPPGPLNNHSLRKLGDSLVQAEKWHLALEVHLKCGFPTAGVMAAHGLACLRAGCFDTAREKISHCMPKLSSELLNATIFKCIMTPPADDCNDNPADWCREQDILHTKRPQRGPPLLQEVLKIIETAPCAKPQPETLQRASIIRNSNTSLASLLSRRKDPCPVRMHEPALNVLTTLANLKHIAKGQYGESQTLSNTNTITGHKSRRPLQHTRGFEECIYYVLTYGSHADVLRFLMRHREQIAALKYILIQGLEADLFIKHIFLVSLRCGEVNALLSCLQAIDSKLLIWRPTLLQTCRYLETQHLLNSLYQLQVLLNDPVRASMTCVRFYSANCENFQQLHANALHLHNAQKHLQSELEVAQWENINVDTVARRRNSSSASSRRTSIATGANTPTLGANFLMQLDARSLNGHINTISMQLDVAKFLAQCEKDNAAEELMTLKILKQIQLEATNKTVIPTLFDATPNKILICILILLCGKNIDEGFGLAYRIIHHYKLPEMKVFAGTAKYLACNHRLAEVEKLLNCITSNNGTSTRDIDEILSISINSATNSHEPEVKTVLDNLAKKIHNVEIRIACHIFIGQLKSAYLLANKHERLADIRKILRQAELTNQVHIKKLCERKLNINASRDQL